MNRCTALFCLILSFIISSCINEENEWDIMGDEVSIGEKVPQFSVLDNAGEVFDNSSLSGKTTVLVFFNTRCGDCRDELPIVQRLYNEFGMCEDVSFMTVSLSENATSINEYWSKNDLSLPYSAQPDKKVYNLFANKVIPMVYVIDNNQIVRFIHTDNPIVDYPTLYKEFNEVRSK